MRDNKLIFSDAQTVTITTAPTTNAYFNLGTQAAPGSGGNQIGQGPHKFILWASIGAAMTAGGTSLRIVLETATAYGGTYYATCIDTGLISAAYLTAGAILMAVPLPRYTTYGTLDAAMLAGIQLLQFIRPYYTCDGTFSGGGTLNCWLDTY
jgi:hypothetical protein